jgi:hypothetical protein
MGKAGKRRAKSKPKVTKKAVKKVRRTSTRTRSKPKKAAAKAAKKARLTSKKTGHKTRTTTKKVGEEATEKQHPRHSTAEEMARRQREISVAEFFMKNRHLLGFDNPRKALLTTIKEGVDNSLDACEEAGILPEVRVTIAHVRQESRFRVTIEDNGPGILEKQIPKIFAKLL